MPEPWRKEEDLLTAALGASDGALSVLCLCDGGRVVVYTTVGESKHFAQKGSGPLLLLLSEAARRAEAGVFSFRDPDGRAAGLVLVEPVEASRVLVGVAPGDRDVAALRMRRAALALRLLG